MLHILNKLRQRAEDEKGFTLIELLVVVLIIGILAAIALPTFLGQRSKAQDAGAKSAARNTVSHVESCFANTQDYLQCTNALLIANEQVPAGDLNNVVVTPDTKDGYGIVATSSSGNKFTITKAPATGAVTRTCVTLGKGACPASGNW
jgi:type IV pilus assembly protein PilA